MKKNSVGFIKEEEYKKIINLVPIFCIDFLIRCDDQFLLIKRLEEPLKGKYWFPGGRLRFKENIQKAAKRIQQKELGRNFPNHELIGFSNYFFKKKISSRALHTPTLLYEVIVEEKFIPEIDSNHSKFKWTSKYPKSISNKIEIFKSNKKQYNNLFL